MKTFLSASFLSLLFFSGVAHGQLRCEKALHATRIFDTQESWAHQSLRNTFDVLSDFFITNKNMNKDAKIDALLDQNIRRYLFRVEGFSRILEDQNPSFFKEQRLQFKALEDALGKVDLAMSLRKTATDLKEPQLVGYFAKQETDARAQLVAKLEDIGLWDQPEVAMKEIRKEFKKDGHWQDGKKEKKFLISALTDYAKELDKSVKANAFDNADIELGLHKLRRSLRWILMQANALSGLIEFKNNTAISPEAQTWINEMQSKNPQLLQNTNLKQAEPLVNQPIEIPQREFTIINELVAQIGEAKDNAEMQIYINEALDHLGVSASKKTKVNEKLSQLLKSEKIDHQELSRQIQARLTATQVLKTYVKSLETLN